MQYIVLLIVVADMYFGTESKAAAVGFHNAVQDFQNGGLSGAVFSDQSHTLTAENVERNIFKQLLSGIGFCQTFYVKYVVAADNVRLQMKLHGSIHFHGFVQNLDLVQHLFPAFCPLDGFFAVK